MAFCQLSSFLKALLQLLFLKLLFQCFCRDGIYDNTAVSAKLPIQVFYFLACFIALYTRPSYYSSAVALIFIKVLKVILIFSQITISKDFNDALALAL